MFVQTFWEVSTHRFEIDLPLHYSSLTFRFTLLKNMLTIEFDILFFTSSCIQLLNLMPQSISSIFMIVIQFYDWKEKSPQNWILLLHLFMNKDSADLKVQNLKRLKFGAYMVNIGLSVTSVWALRCQCLVIKATEVASLLTPLTLVSAPLHGTSGEPLLWDGFPTMQSCPEPHN